MSRSAVPLWSFGGGPGSWSYETFDTARRWLNHGLARYLLCKLTPAGAAPRTLEAGSGPGHCSSLLGAARAGVRATLLDVDPAVLDLAVKRDPKLAVVQGDLYRMPFREGTFDLVFNSSTMEHLDAFETALGEMVRVTRPGGRIFVGVPYRYGPFFPFNLIPVGHPVSTWMGRLYSRRQLAEACAVGGIEVEERVGYFLGCFIGTLLVRVGGP